MTQSQKDQNQKHYLCHYQMDWVCCQAADHRIRHHQMGIYLQRQMFAHRMAMGCCCQFVVREKIYTDRRCDTSRWQRIYTVVYYFHCRQMHWKVVQQGCKTVMGCCPTTAPNLVREFAPFTKGAFALGKEFTGLFLITSIPTTTAKWRWSGSCPKGRRTGSYPTKR